MASTTTGRVEDCRWLVAPEAEPWLALAADGSLPLVTRVARLRQHLSRERAHLAIELAELRVRADEKFSRAGQMFFVRRALEQATDEVVAGYKAARFAGRSHVCDLCTGIGGDLIGLTRADRGPPPEVLAVDRDLAMLVLAEANLQAYSETSHTQVAGRTRFLADDVRAIDVAACDAWHLDPDRRPEGRRTTRVERYDPGAAAIDAMLARNANAAIKLAPAADVPDRWGEAAELEWISHRGECRQQVAWFGALASAPGHRQATIIKGPRAPVRSLRGEAGLDVPAAEVTGHFVFEPDAAVLAARLEGALAAEHSLVSIAPGVAYWTGERPIDDAALDCFEVQEVLPFDEKRLREELRRRRVGRLEIKCRGVRLDPDELRRRLKPAGDGLATLLITRRDRRTIAILAQRVPPEG